MADMLCEFQLLHGVEDLLEDPAFLTHKDQRYRHSLFPEHGIRFQKARNVLAGLQGAHGQEISRLQLETQIKVFEKEPPAINLLYRNASLLYYMILFHP